MDENVPLDSDISYEFSDDRPAGEWLEGYWRQAIPWAKGLAITCWAYVGWKLVGNFRYLFQAGEDFIIQSGILLSILLYDSPAIALGYFLYRFSDRLQTALATTDQQALEDAFTQFHRAILMGIILTVIWAIGFAFSLYTWFRLSQTFDSF